MVSVASAAAHPMHGQWTWQSTPNRPRGSSRRLCTDVSLRKKGAAFVHSPSFWGAGDHVSTSVAMALSETFDEKACAPPVEQQMLTKTPAEQAAQSKTLSANWKPRYRAALAEECAQMYRNV